MQITWGQVTSISPSLQVRILGDLVDTPVGFVNDDVTLADGNRVLLVKPNTTWIVVCKLVAS